MNRIVCFGEIMLRLMPPGFQRFVQADSFEATYGGGEANVAVSLANFGAQAAFVTKLPENPLGQAALNALRRYGVDTSGIVRGGERLGIYFLEKGASQRASVVVYDRKGSSIATASRSDFDWDRLFDGASWFHFTGITPALGDEAAAVTLDACRAARAKGLTVSCDLNYRKNLWSSEKAGAVMAGLMPFVDVCIANEEDAEKVFGIAAESSTVEKGQLDRAGYESVARQLTDRFGFRAVAITLRESLSASDNVWSGMLRTAEGCWFTPRYAMRIVDRVGGGDAFAAGLIHGMTSGYAPEESIGFAVAASCLKHAIEGDFNQVSVKEARDLMKGGGSGRVQR
jgi:2-dehydro-3-deoxygluconokinase